MTATQADDQNSAANWSGFGDALHRLYRSLSKPRQRQLFVVLALMLAGAWAELASIGAVVPFLALLADPGGLGHFPWAERAFAAVGAASAGDRLLVATLTFSIFVLVAGMLRLQLAWYTQDFMFRMSHELSVNIHRRLLSQPYSFHTANNSVSLVSAIGKTESLMFDLLVPLMQAATAAFVGTLIVIALVVISPTVTLSVALAISLVYLTISGLTRHRLKANSSIVGTAWDDRLKVAQESLQGIRDVIIDNAQDVHSAMFERVNLRLSLARANTIFLGNAPRFLIEAVGIVVIALIAVVISRNGGGLAVALPILGAVALGAQRLLPLLQQIYVAWSVTAGNQSLLLQVLAYLALPLRKETDVAPAAGVPFTDKISLRDVTFTHPGRPHAAVDAVTLDIRKGSTIALIGETGSGKSTLADIVMGLLRPQQGEVLVDDRPLGPEDVAGWQKMIAHVPQSIFVADGSIASNIALSLPGRARDDDRIRDAARRAHLSEFIDTLADGYETIVGENGVRLSGGQRQRLGIARAIYKGATILVLDEATSALDEVTEAAVMSNLEALRADGRTILLVTHRPSIIRRCDAVVRLEDGRVIEVVGRERTAGVPASAARH